MVSDGWRDATVGELCDEGELHTQTGPFGSQLHSYDYVEQGIPVVPTEGIGRRRLLTDGIPQVGDDTAARLSRHRLKAGDILFARRGVQATGLSALVTQHEEGWICGTGAILLRVLGDGIDPEFLSFLLSSSESIQWLKQHAVGAVMPNLNEGVIRQLPLTLPPLPEQKAIAAVLGALDDKIELNRRMNATLESMARALFQSWFVDFDPVRAKLDGRQPPNLDPATAALFPDSFQDSELGHIPKGWEVKPLGEVIELAYGKPLKAEDRKNGPICVYGANGPVGWHDEKLVSGPGIVVGRKGNPGVVTWAHGDFYPIDTTFYVEPKGECRSLYFLFYALSNHDLASLSADSAVPGLNRNHAYMSKQVIPPAGLLEAFDKQAAPIFAAMHAHEIQSRTLATLRDTLLPKLLSGELSFKEPVARIRHQPQ